jgi:hypothetical protein
LRWNAALRADGCCLAHNFLLASLHGPDRAIYLLSVRSGDGSHGQAAG